MRSLPCPSPAPAFHADARRGSIYLVVLVTIATVTTMILLGITLRKSANEAYRTGIEAVQARNGARSAVESTLVQLQRDPDGFAAKLDAGVLIPWTTLGGTEIGAIAVDKATQGSVSGSSGIVQIHAAGRSGLAESSIGYDLVRDYNAGYLKVLVDLGASSYWALSEGAGSYDVLDQIGGVYGTYEPGTASGEVFLDGEPAPTIVDVSTVVKLDHEWDFETGSGSIVFWARIDDSTSPSIQGLVVKEKHTTPKLHLAIYAEGNQIKVDVDSRNGYSGEIVSVSADSFADGDWHHVAYTFGLSGAKLFVDGVLVASNRTYLLGLKSVQMRETNMASWTIGARCTSSRLSDPLSGSVARFAFFPEQLSDSSITKLMEAQLNAAELSVVEGSFVRVVE